MFSLAKKLSLTVRGVMASAIDNLFTALKGRATYSENIADSKQVVKDIDNYELLDKASILLTPTAYSDARVHSVKTYTGDELVTNGTFDTDSNWFISSQSAISNGTARILSTDGSYQYISQSKLEYTNTQGKYVKITLDIVNYVSGTLKAQFSGGTSYSFPTSVGTHTIYVLNDGSSGTFNLARVAGVTDITIDNVSVTEADADFDFDRASSATRINSDGLVQDMQSITDPELVLNGDFEELGDDAVTNGTFDTDSDWTIQNNTGTDTEITSGNLRIETDGAYTQVSQSSVLVGGNQYKLIYTILSSDNGDLGLVTEGNVTVSIPSSVGTHTYYFTAHSTSFVLKRRGGALNLTIDNVSVQQVDPNDRWTLTQATITDGSLNLSTSDGSYTAATQTLGTIGNVYEISLDVSDIVGTISVAIGGGTDVDITTNGTHTVYITSASTTFEIKRKFGITNVSATIDNISVKDITFSTDVDLARINYDSNGENGHWLLEPTSTNLITYSEDFSEWTSAGVTVEGGYLAPDGNNSAYKVSGTVGSSSIYLAGLAGVNETNTRTIWAKTVSGTGTVNLCSYGQNTNNNFTITENWQRFEVNGTTTSTGAANFYAVDFRFEEPNALSELIIWGAQAEALSYATSYIPTYGSTVTRATETLTGSGNSTLINSTEGVLYAEIAALADDGTNRLISLSNADTSQQVWLYFNTSNGLTYRIYNGSTQSTYSHSINTKTFNKIAVKYKANDFGLFVNGTKVYTDTSGSTFTENTLTKLNFDAGDGALDFYGEVKALTVFDEALTDDELELLTGITNYGSFNELAQANSYTII